MIISCLYCILSHKASPLLWDMPISIYNMFICSNKHLLLLLISPTNCTIQLNSNTNGNSLEVVRSYKYLGFHIKNTLSWNDHINLIAKKLKACTAVLLRCQNFLPTDKLKLIFNAIGLPYINYGLTLYSLTHKQALNKTAWSEIYWMW